MTMQIKKIVIYHVDGRTREIDLNLQQVNVITGNSSTGKTTLIDIVEYCFGSSDYRIKIRSEVAVNVACYGVLYQLDDRQIFIAKRVTQGISRSSLYFLEGYELDVPKLSEIEDNYNDEDLKDYLASLIGIPENEIEPNSNLPKYSANIRHTSFYTFLDSPIDGKQLFYKQENSQIARTIKDTMPVILKAVQSNYVALQKELRQKKALQRNIKAEIDNANEMEVKGTTLVPGLLLEARDLGLLSPDLDITVTSDGRSILENLVAQGIPDNTWVPDTSAIADLQQQQAQLVEALTIEQAKLAEYQEYSREATQFQRLVAEHDHRLSMADLFEATDEATSNLCPICGSSINEHNPDVHDLQQARRDIQQQLQIVQHKRPVLTNVIDTIQTKIRQLRQDIKQVDISMETIFEEQHKAKNNQIPRQSIARFLGGINMYLRLAPTSDDQLADLKRQLTEVNDDIDNIQQLIEDALGEERLRSVLYEISTYMTEYGARIGEEYRGANFRFDLNKLTVFVTQREDFREFGRTIGSDKNYLQIHIILYLALHRYFTLHKCPVPSFLIIDQIDRPFYPDDVNYKNITASNPEQLMKDPDRQALMEVFVLLSEVCATLGIQILLLQHANFPDENYQKAIIQNWRDGEALIPEDWIELREDK